MSVGISPERGSVLLEGLSWATFEALLADLGDGRGRLAFSDGVLEIMTAFEEHEHVGCLLGRFVGTLTEELDIELKSVASTTLERADLEKAIEADRAFYIGRESVERKGPIMDLPREAPPDLGIEVGVSRKALARLPIHAALGVPEVWTWEKGQVTFHGLTESGDYAVIERSRNLPMLTAADLNRWLARAEELGETKLIREFRSWVRESFGEGGAPGGKTA